jgi:hypothetical protein
LHGKPNVLSAYQAFFTCLYFYFFEIPCILNYSKGPLMFALSIL